MNFIYPVFILFYFIFHFILLLRVVLRKAVVGGEKKQKSKTLAAVAFDLQMRGGKKGKRQNTSARLQTCTDTGVLRPSTPPLTPHSSPLPPWVLFATELMRLCTGRLLSCRVSIFFSFFSKTLQGEKQACTHQWLAIYRLGCFLSMGGGGEDKEPCEKKTFRYTWSASIKIPPSFSPLEPTSRSRRRSRSSLKVASGCLSLLHPRSFPELNATVYLFIYLCIYF